MACGTTATRTLPPPPGNKYRSSVPPPPSRCRGALPTPAARLAAMGPAALSTATSQTTALGGTRTKAQRHTIAYAAAARLRCGLAVTLSRSGRASAPATRAAEVRPARRSCSCTRSYAVTLRSTQLRWHCARVRPAALASVRWRTLRTRHSACRFAASHPADASALFAAALDPLHELRPVLAVHLAARLVRQLRGGHRHCGLLKTHDGMHVAAVRGGPLPSNCRIPREGPLLARAAMRRALYTRAASRMY
jgi:hypothetical protein